MRDRPDQRGPVTLHFSDGFGDTVLTDDGDVFFASSFADGIYGTQST